MAMADSSIPTIVCTNRLLKRSQADRILFHILPMRGCGDDYIYENSKVPLHSRDEYQGTKGYHRLRSLPH